jgi:hypothetical protein
MPEMYERGKSDRFVVPAKLANNTVTAVAESVEERHPAKGNGQGNTSRTQSRYRCVT